MMSSLRRLCSTTSFLIAVVFARNGAAFSFSAVPRRQQNVVFSHRKRQSSSVRRVVRSEDPSSLLVRSSSSSSQAIGTTDSDNSSINSDDTSDDVVEPSLVNENDDDQQAATPFRRTRTYCITGVTRRAGALNEAVAYILNNEANMTISLQEATELINIGAVWARMQSLDEQDLLLLYDQDDDASSNSRALYADVQVRMQQDSLSKSDGDDENLDQYVQRLENQRFRRILSPSWIEAGTDVRIYPHPRRFPSCYEMNQESLLYEDTTFVVVDKPPMLPTQPDSSNYVECCPGCTNDILGPFQDITGRTVPRPLLCHRVDACVGGCVVMSKDRNGQKVFHRLQRERKLRKLYLAVTTQPVPLGMHLHWMWAPQSARGKSGGPPCQIVSLEPPESRRKAREFWHRCLLEVVKCEPIQIDKNSEHHSYDPSLVQQHYQSTIRLVTGRKHQVRAQLAALGCPIIRDTLYAPMAGLTLDRLDQAEDDMDKAVASCRVPAEPIGLQAHAILFGGIRARAQTPWWGK